MTAAATDTCSGQTPGVFRECSSCGHVWPGRGDFLSDPQVSLVGYQVNFGKLEAGFFLFNHVRPDCGTTLGLEVAHFADLYNGPVFQVPLKGTKGCTAQCLKQDALEIETCPQPCECAFVLQVIQIIKQWPKH